MKDLPYEVWLDIFAFASSWELQFPELKSGYFAWSKLKQRLCQRRYDTLYRLSLVNTMFYALCYRLLYRTLDLREPGNGMQDYSSSLQSLFQKKSFEAGQDSGMIVCKNLPESLQKNLDMSEGVVHTAIIDHTDFFQEIPLGVKRFITHSIYRFSCLECEINMNTLLELTTLKELSCKYTTIWVQDNQRPWGITHLTLDVVKIVTMDRELADDVHKLVTKRRQFTAMQWFFSRNTLPQLQHLAFRQAELYDLKQKQRSLENSQKFFNSLDSITISFHDIRTRNLLRTSNVDPRKIVYNLNIEDIRNVFRLEESYKGEEIPWIWQIPQVLNVLFSPVHLDYEQTDSEWEYEFNRQLTCASQVLQERGWKRVHLSEAWTRLATVFDFSDGIQELSTACKISNAEFVWETQNIELYAESDFYPSPDFTNYIQQCNSQF